MGRLYNRWRPSTRVASSLAVVQTFLCPFLYLCCPCGHASLAELDYHLKNLFLRERASNRRSVEKRIQIPCSVCLLVSSDQPHGSVCSSNLSIQMIQISMFRTVSQGSYVVDRDVCCLLKRRLWIACHGRWLRLDET